MEQAFDRMRMEAEMHETPTKSAILDEMPLAIAYVPRQVWRELYDADIGFQRGTIFRELDKPFIGEEAIPSVRA